MEVYKEQKEELEEENEVEDEEEDEEDDNRLNKEITKKTAMDNNWISETKWGNVKNIYHKYLPTFPKYLKKDKKLEIELPYPIYSSNLKLKVDVLWKPFEPKSDTARLNYYRKLFSKEKNKLSPDNLTKNVVILPKYVVDTAMDPVQTEFNDVWHYSGGLLDCIKIKKVPYTVYLDSPNQINCLDINGKSLVSSFRVDNSLPIYNLKCNSNDNNPLLGVRQQSQILLFELFRKKSITKSFWSKTNRTSFVDMSFNEYHNEQFFTLDVDHNLEVVDITKQTTLSKYSFPTNNGNLVDRHANILLLDANTLVCMDRCCVYMLDFRSNSVQHTWVKDDLLVCDEFCSLSKKNSDTLYLHSMHTILEFDVNSFNCSNKIMHLMSSPPIISSCVQYDGETHLTLVSPSDTVLMRTTDQLLSLPQCVPSVLDTMSSMCFTVKLDNLNILDERLTFPIVGMKLYIDPSTDDLFMLTSNTAGDVFKQKILNDGPAFIDPVNLLSNWTRKLSKKRTTLEATSICNLNHVVHNMTTKLPTEKHIHSIMSKDKSHEFCEKKIQSIQKDLKSKVGEVMNALWDDDAVPDMQDNTISAENKVMEWLQTN